MKDLVDSSENVELCFDENCGEDNEIANQALIGFGPPIDSDGRALLSELEIKDLIVSHMVHGERLAKSFLRRWRVVMPNSHVTSVVGISLTEAANRFDPTRGVNFKTFFFYHLKGMLAKELRRSSNSEKMIQHNGEDGSVPDYVGTEDEGDGGDWLSNSCEQRSPERLFQKRQLMRFVWSACEQLDDLEQEVLVRHYVQEQSMTDIAGDLGYSRCHISRVKSFALVRLEKTIRHLNIRSSSDDVVEERNTCMRPAIIDAIFKRKSYSGGRGRRPSSAKEMKFRSLVEYITDMMG